MLVVGGHDGAKHLNDFYQFLGDFRPGLGRTWDLL